MADDDDDSKEVLEKLLQQLFAQAARDQTASGQTADSYLIASDNQYLGKITDNSFDTESILNEYGPYGSSYSGTSIFNDYSPYGSPYGHMSVNNPYCATPPRLFLQGRFAGVVTANEYLADRIPVKAFLYALRNDIHSLLRGNIPKNETQARLKRGDAFIEAADGTFLGSLNPNRFDTESIFNRFGDHGSRFGQNSIFNRFSSYGGKFSQFSPFNPRALRPPVIFLNGSRYGYLTTNTRFNPRVDPNDIQIWAERNVRRRYV